MSLFAKAAAAACESIAAEYRAHADILTGMVAANERNLLREPLSRAVVDAMRAGAQVLRLHAELTIKSVPDIVTGVEQAILRRPHVEASTCECCVFSGAGFNPPDAHVHGYPMDEACPACGHARREHRS